MRGEVNDLFSLKSCGGFCYQSNFVSRFKKIYLTVIELKVFQFVRNVTLHLRNTARHYSLRPVEYFAITAIKNFCSQNVQFANRCFAILHMAKAYWKNF